MSGIGPETGRAAQRVVGIRRSAYRPVDGFVVGGALPCGAGNEIWILVNKPGEGLMEFFLEDEHPGQTADPWPVACLGLRPDGRLRIGRLDWGSDRFLSELIEGNDDGCEETGL